ncbi:hypothetical protein MHN83_23405 [Mycobacterium sp. CnD-18-1]|nr:hypothetical protein [Mycobacterium sp. CnD-18-1]
MALNNAAMIVAANALRGAMVGMQIHAGDPGASGTANTTTAARKAIAWGAASGNGDFGLASPIMFTGGAASGAAQWVSLWSTSTTGGTHYGNFQLTGDQTFNSAGEYTVTALNMDGSAS